MINYFLLLISVSSQSFANSSKPLIIGGTKISQSSVQQVQGLYQPIGAGLEEMSSATVIGPKVVLTAGHSCQEPRWLVYKNAVGKKVGVTLEPSPNFKYDNTCAGFNVPYDFAGKNDLCLGILDEATDIPPISITDAIPVVGETVMLVGLGDPGDPWVGERQFGKMTVEKVSDIGATLQNDTDSIASDSGDSGGATFRIDKDNKMSYLGVTSTSTRRGTECGVPAFRTGIALSGSKPGLEFIRAFAAAHNVEICGINKACADVYWNPEPLEIQNN